MKQRAFIFCVVLALLAVSAWTGTRAQAAQLRQGVTAATAAVADAGPGVAYQAPGTPSPSVAGATTPFTTYQAPEATLGGGASVVSLTSAPTSEYDSPQGEASGHAYAQLTGNGQSVQWTNDTGEPTYARVAPTPIIPDATTVDVLTGAPTEAAARITNADALCAANPSSRPPR